MATTDSTGPRGVFGLEKLARNFAPKNVQNSVKTSNSNKLSEKNKSRFNISNCHSYQIDEIGKIWNLECCVKDLAVVSDG